ncbi:MAG: hypothetical protein ACOVQY_09670 [Erythrobacter sp.]
MRLPIIVFLALSGCSAGEGPVGEATEAVVVTPLTAAEQSAVIKRIEASIGLPPSAASMDEYSRNYGMRGDGKVLGVYAKRRNLSVSDDICKGCTEEQRQERQRLAKETEDWWVERYAPTGESRWIGNFDDYPSLMDGGCLQIQVIYDLAKQHVEGVWCNGVA